MSRLNLKLMLLPAFLFAASSVVELQASPKSPKEFVKEAIRTPGKVIKKIAAIPGKIAKSVKNHSHRSKKAEKACCTTSESK